MTKIKIKTPTTHTISIRNKKTNETKNFSITTKLNSNKIKEITQKYLTQLEIEESPYINPNTNSHNIVIIPKNNNEKHSVSFNINLPTYTCNEIANRIENHYATNAN